MSAHPFRSLALALVVVVLGFAGCGRKEPVPVSPTPALSEVLDIRVGEKFAFEKEQYVCRRGQALHIRITNTIPAGGPDIAHNIALLSPGTDIEQFSAAIIGTAEEQNYIPEGWRHRVLAAAPLVHPGQTLHLQLNAPAEPGEYPIVCTFPGHCVLGMRARLIVQ